MKSASLLWFGYNYKFYRPQTARYVWFGYRGVRFKISSATSFNIVSTAQESEDGRRPISCWEETYLLRSKWK